MPTTINEIILNDKYKLDKYSGIVETIPENLIKKGDHLISNGNTYIVSDYLIPTIELKPFSTLHGYINFFDVPYNIDLTSGKVFILKDIFKENSKGYRQGCLEGQQVVRCYERCCIYRSYCRVRCKSYCR